MRKLTIALMMTFFTLFGSAAMAESPAAVNFGMLFYDGQTVRTIVPPASMPKPGRDNLYVVLNGGEEQLAIAAVAPGDKNYHGGKWAFHSVMWLTVPFLLKSEQDVLSAASYGDLTVTRLPQNDFKCPIQP